MIIKISKIKEIVKESTLTNESSLGPQKNQYKKLLLKLLQDPDSEFVMKLTTKIKKYKIEL